MQMKTHSERTFISLSVLDANDGATGTSDQAPERNLLRHLLIDQFGAGVARLGHDGHGPTESGGRRGHGIGKSGQFVLSLCGCAFDARDGRGAA